MLSLSFYPTRRKTAILRRVISMSIVLLFMGVWQGFNQRNYAFSILCSNPSSSFFGFA